MVHILRGDTKAATSYISQALAQQPDCPQALLCSVYLELHAGHSDVALQILKRHRHPK